MGKHTPGPWIAEFRGVGEDDLVPARIIAPNGCGTGCRCEVAAEVMPEDARLIAAAPALAEALAALLDLASPEDATEEEAPVYAAALAALRAAGLIE